MRLAVLALGLAVMASGAVAQDVWRGSQTPRPPFPAAGDYCRLFTGALECASALVVEGGGIVGSGRRCGVPEGRMKPITDRIREVAVTITFSPDEGAAVRQVYSSAVTDVAHPDGGRQFGIACDELLLRIEAFERALGLRRLLR